MLRFWYFLTSTGDKRQLLEDLRSSIILQKSNTSVPHGLVVAQAVTFEDVLGNFRQFDLQTFPDFEVSESEIRILRVQQTLTNFSDRASIRCQNRASAATRGKTKRLLPTRTVRRDECDCHKVDSKHSRLSFMWREQRGNDIGGGQLASIQTFQSLRVRG